MMQAWADYLDGLKAVAPSDPGGAPRFPEVVRRLLLPFAIRQCLSSRYGLPESYDRHLARLRTAPMPAVSPLVATRQTRVRSHHLRFRGSYGIITT